MTERNGVMAARIAQALALRYAFLARQLAATAGLHDEAPFPEIDVLPDSKTLTTRYRGLLNEWLSEPLTSHHEALALAHFAAAVISDIRVTRALNESGIAGDEIDHHDAVVAMTTLAHWLNERDLADYGAETRRQAGAVG